MDTKKLDPKTCSERICHSSENLLHARWISSQVIQILLKDVSRPLIQIRFCLAVIVVHTMVPWLKTNTHGQRGTRLMVETKTAYEISLKILDTFTSFRMLSRRNCYQTKP